MFTARTHAEECGETQSCAPLRLSGEIKVDAWRNVHGGVHSGSAGLYDVFGALDADLRAWGFAGVTARASALYNPGGSISALTGDGQAISNIETDRVGRLYELWVQYEFGESPFSLRSGLYDLNSEFDVVEPATLFLNASHGINPALGQSGQNGPSIFPALGFGLRLSWTSDHVDMRSAMVDASPGTPSEPTGLKSDWRSDDGALWISEVSVHNDAARLIGGVWRFTRGVPMPLDGAQNGSNSGVYLAAAFPATLASKSLDYFVRVGGATTATSRFDRFASGGLVAKGWMPHRADDQFGLGIATARPAAWLAEAGGTWETSVEITWQAQLTEWFAVQPDVQYIFHPAEADVSGALAAGLRFIAKWE
jgi:porin